MKRKIHTQYDTKFKYKSENVEEIAEHKVGPVALESSIISEAKTTIMLPPPPNHRNIRGL